MVFTTRYDLRNDPAEIPRVHQLLDALGRDQGLPEGVTFTFKLALEELLTNVMRCGYADEAEHLIEVHVRVGEGQMEVQVHDDALPFDPLARESPDVSLNIDVREIGGLGIHLVREMMDEVEYRRKRGRNILTMRKATA